MTTKIAAVFANEEADASLALLNNGTIKIYDGAQPATPETAITTQTMLVSFALENPAFDAAVAGVAAVAGDPLEGTVVAASTATWARMFTSGSAARLDCAVGESAAEIILSETDLEVDDVVQLTTYNYHRPLTE